MDLHRKLTWVVRALLLGALAALALPGTVSASSPAVGDEGRSAPEARLPAATRVLVRFRAAADAGDRAEARREAGTPLEETLPVRGLQLVDPKPGLTVGAAIDRLERSPEVLYAEPDAPRRVVQLPNDRYFSVLWGLHNTGQSIAGGPPGTPDADIDAPEAWDLTTGAPSVAVGVVDSGVDATHPDLRPNEWTNPGESGAGREANGRDDDGNGEIDDVHGWDWVDGDNAPSDLHGHGTHVAGTIAARGNDGEGVTGVSWSSSLAPLRVLAADGTGYSSDAIKAYAYAGRSGLRVVNASLGGPQGSRAERDAIAGTANTLFVVAAGNGGADGVGDDNEAAGEYPCNYDLANLICVAATDANDRLAGFSNYGARSVDLAAPGVDVGSTYPGAQWVYMDGTSMAAPHVAGAAALVLARSPGASVAEVRSALLGGVDLKPSLAGKTVTGGRLNAHRAVALVSPPVGGTGTSQPPPAPAPAPAPAAPADTTAPTVSISTARTQRLGTVIRRGLRPLLRLSEAGTVRATLEVSAATARRLGLGRGTRAVRIGSATATYTAAGSRRVTIRLTASARRRLARARSVTTTLGVRAADARGNARTSARRIALRR